MHTLCNSHPLQSACLREQWLLHHHHRHLLGILLAVRYHPHLQLLSCLAVVAALGVLPARSPPHHRSSDGLLVPPLARILSRRRSKIETHGNKAVAIAAVVYCDRSHGTPCVVFLVRALFVIVYMRLAGLTSLSHFLRASFAQLCTCCGSVRNSVFLLCKLLYVDLGLFVYDCAEKLRYTMVV